MPTLNKNTTQKTPLPLLLVAVVCLLSLLATYAATYSFASDEAPASGQLLAKERIKPLGVGVEYPEGSLAEGLTFDELVVYKSERRLHAKAGGKVMRVYAIALGFTPEGHKLEQGDGKTPEGTYFISYKNLASAYHKSLRISYPNAKDTAKANARGKSPGGDIVIHGLAPAFAHLGIQHRASDWTWGCVALSNEEMDELFSRTPTKTKITLLP